MFKKLPLLTVTPFMFLGECRSLLSYTKNRDVFSPLNSNYFFGQSYIESGEPLGVQYLKGDEGFKELTNDTCYTYGVKNVNNNITNNFNYQYIKEQRLLKKQDAKTSWNSSQFNLHSDAMNNISDCNENAYLNYNNDEFIFNQGTFYSMNSGTYHTISNFTDIMKKSVKKIHHVGDKVYIFTNGMTLMEDYKYFTKGFINIIEVDLNTKTDRIIDITDFAIPLNFQFMNSKPSLRDITPSAAGVSGDIGFKGMSKVDVEKFFTVIETDNNANQKRINYDLELHNNKLSFAVGKFEFDLSSNTPSVIKDGNKEVYASWLVDGVRKYMYMPEVKTTKADIDATMNSRTYLVNKHRNDPDFINKENDAETISVKNELNNFMTKEEIDSYNAGNVNELYNAYINDGRIYYDAPLSDGVLEYDFVQENKFINATGNLTITNGKRNSHIEGVHSYTNFNFNLFHFNQNVNNFDFHLMNWMKDTRRDAIPYPSNANRNILNSINNGYVDINLTETSYSGTGGPDRVLKDSTPYYDLTNFMDALTNGFLLDGTLKNTRFINKHIESLKRTNSGQYADILNILSNGVKHYTGLKGVVANCAKNKFDLGSELNALVKSDETLCPTRDKLNTYVNNNGKLNIVPETLSTIHGYIYGYNLGNYSTAGSWRDKHKYKYSYYKPA